MFEEHWNRVLPHDLARLHILAIFHWFLQLEILSLLRGVNLSQVTKWNWEVLESIALLAVGFYLPYSKQTSLTMH
jgi:hypothetical protein